MRELPIEVTNVMIQYLDFKDLLSIALVSRGMFRKIRGCRLEGLEIRINKSTRWDINTIAEKVTLDDMAPKSVEYLLSKNVFGSAREITIRKTFNTPTHSAITFPSNRPLSWETSYATLGYTTITKYTFMKYLNSVNAIVRQYVNPNVQIGIEIIDIWVYKFTCDKIPRCVEVVMHPSDHHLGRPYIYKDSLYNHISKVTIGNIAKKQPNCRLCARRIKFRSELLVIFPNLKHININVADFNFDDLIACREVLESIRLPKFHFDTLIASRLLHKYKTSRDCVFEKLKQIHFRDIDDQKVGYRDAETKWATEVAHMIFPNANITIKNADY